ncbi:MAG TPA: HAMP domain-containing histidine kinase [Gammaproteobacteria bacterium]|nr:HAMP domain-containing histidine kinase [Gammaproteobacteria bacterium]
MSYRYRLPLSLVATVLFTAGVIGVVIVWHTYNNVRGELVDNGARFGFALAAALRPALLHDDVWLAYSILRGHQDSSGKRSATYITLDSKNRIFASNDPHLFPIATSLQAVDLALASAVTTLLTKKGENFVVDLDSLPERLLMVTPISSNGESVGALLLVYPRHILWPRFTAIVKQGSFSVFLVLSFIVPVGWYWGRRLVQPLVTLANCMVRVGKEDPERIDCAMMEGDDEIGRLNRHFRELLTGLKEKAELERQMVVSERLAAVGRLASEVAHEINNPLGGMLMTIDTLRKRGVTEPHTERTLLLLERGLTQIQDTVSALLLESRLERHPLTTQDINDTRTLVIAQAEKRGVSIDWDNRIDKSVSLPSTLVRQIVINLLLNAVQSTFSGGKVIALFRLQSGKLEITLSNEGKSIDEATLKYLFEPYFSTRKEGSGLGLWVTYQIVQQLDGEITVSSEHGLTRFSVTLPLRGKEKPLYAA